LEETSCGKAAVSMARPVNSGVGNEKSAYLAVLVHAGVESAADSVLDLEELDLDRLITEEMVRSQEVLEGDQTRRAGSDDGDLLHLALANSETMKIGKGK